MDMGWKSSNGQPVVIEATGLYIDGEFLEDTIKETNDE